MSKQVLVGIVMGSDSDWPIMKAAAETLKNMGIPYEAKVLSAHRTPDLMFQFAEEAKVRGIKCQDADSRARCADAVEASDGSGFPAFHGADAGWYSCCHVCSR